MIVNRFEVFGFDRIRDDTGVAIQRDRNVAYDVFNELGIVICALGHEFFIRALQQTPDLAR